VRTVLPDGKEILHPFVRLRAFPSRDLFRLFWLPYGVGLAFLLLGGWVFMLRGDTRPDGPSAICTAVTNTLLFRQSPHVLSSTWTLSTALLAGRSSAWPCSFPKSGRWCEAFWLRFLLIDLVLLSRMGPD
jgi:hypothetical protein